MRPPARTAVYDAIERLRALPPSAARGQQRAAVKAVERSYAVALEEGVADPRMAATLVKEWAGRRALAQVEALWRSIRRSAPDGPPRLTSPLSTVLITGFARCGAWHHTHEVLACARGASVANTIVFNSFLHACSRRAKAAGGADSWGWGRDAPPVEAAPGAAAAALSARAALHRMRLDGVAPDAHSTGLAIAVFGHARQMDAARRVLAEAEPAAVDVVAYNSLLHAAATNAEAPLALDLLEQMPQHGLTPDLRSYNTVLQALAAAQRLQHAGDLFDEDGGGGGGSGEAAATAGAFDLVAEAGYVRDAMAQAGVHEDGVTRTSLLSLYSDTPLAEGLLADLDEPSVRRQRPRQGDDPRATSPDEQPRWNPSPPQLRSFLQTAAVDATGAASSAAAATRLEALAADALAATLATRAGEPEARALIDLRGCTRPSAVVALRGALDRAADAHALGRTAAGWHIVCSERAANPRQEQRQQLQQRRRRQQYAAERPQSTMHRTACEFLEESGIHFEAHHDTSLRISTIELNRAAATLHGLRTRQAVIQSGLFRIGLAFSAISAMCILPRLGGVT